MFDIFALSTAFGGFVWVLFFFVLALSIIVAVHEYGHYIVGRWCGIHAEVFSIGFGTVLISWMDKHGTKWQFAALPFGGYVRFKGDENAVGQIDPGSTSSKDSSELRRTMHGAPIWARAATAFAGPAFNFILSIIVFCCLFMWQGQYSENLLIAKLAPVPGQSDLKIGDEIIAVNKTEVANFESFFLVGQDLNSPVIYTVKRNGNTLEALGPVPFPALVGQVSPRSAAFEAGILAGDVITHMSGAPIRDFGDLQHAVAAAEDDSMSFTVWRRGVEFDVTLKSKAVAVPGPDGSFTNRRLVGISSAMFFEPGTLPLPFITALKAATARTWFIIKISLSGLSEMVLGKISACNLSGPVAIAETAGQVATQGTIPFLALIAGLSTAVGLMNLFPIPVLDGGHLIMCAYEFVTGRKPRERTLQLIMSAGLFFILSLTVFTVVMNMLCP